MLLSGGDKEYLVATGADRIWVSPQSFLEVNGLTASAIFLGDTMQKLGIKWDVARVGPYKDAPDALTRASMSREQRESLDTFLDSEMRRYEGLVAEARGLLPGAIPEGARGGAPAAAPGGPREARRRRGGPGAAGPGRCGAGAGGQVDRDLLADPSRAPLG